MTSVATPITTTLATVPSPGPWRSGIHSSSTTTPDEDHDGAEGERQAPATPVVEDVPRVEAELGLAPSSPC